jgi:hypothetical protein
MNPGQAVVSRGAGEDSVSLEGRAVLRPYTSLAMSSFSVWDDLFFATTAKNKKAASKRRLFLKVGELLVASIHERKIRHGFEPTLSLRPCPLQI